MNERYPAIPGYKESDTSKAAAITISAKASTVRSMVASCYLYYGPATADEVAERLGLSILTVRPRVSELIRMGLLHDTGYRRRNASGHSAKVYAIHKN